MPNPNAKGSGEAYQSWNKDQAMATALMRVATAPVGLRPPVSASATSCSSSAEGARVAAFGCSGIAVGAMAT
jgi:hypothetical protein